VRCYSKRKSHVDELYFHHQTPRLARSPEFFVMYLTNKTGVRLL
jgi:hypothetical protein